MNTENNPDLVPEIQDLNLLFEGCVDEDFSGENK